MKQILKDWTWFEKIWLFTSVTTMIVLSIWWKDSWIGMISSLAGMLSVVLVAKGKISNYYFGIINVSLYAILAYNQAFYGEVMLNALYFLPMQFYGLWIWRKKTNKQDGFDIKVVRMTRTQKWNWAIIAIVATVLYAIILHFMKGNLPIIDSFTAILQILAMWFMVKRYKEQWTLWIIVDVFTIGMWLYAFMKTGNDISILVMWIAYLINAVYGYWNWNKALKKEVV